MKVMLISSEYPFSEQAQFGGGGSHVFYLAYCLARAGAEVTVVANEDATKARSPLESLSNVAVVGFPFQAFRRSEDRAYEAALDLVPSWKPDVIHGHHYDGGVLARLLVAVHGLPAALTMHKPPKLAPQAYSVSDPRYKRSRGDALWRELATDHRFGMHVAYSKIYVQENLDVGVPNDRIVYIPHGVPLDLLTEKSGLPKTKRLRIPVHRAVVLCPLRPEKRGVDTFLDAAAVIRAKLGADSPFFIVSGDPRRGRTPESRQAAQKNVLRARGHGLETADLLFRSYSLRQMWDVLARADVCVIPSDREGLSITALEAMAVGTPLVASEVLGLCEVIEHGRTGLLFEPGKSDLLSAHVLRLLGDRNYALRLRQTARRSVQERFSGRRMAEGHLTAYARLCTASTETSVDRAARPSGG